jgi:hypothetical protein
MRIRLKKAGTNEHQRPITYLVGPAYEPFPLNIGDTFHITDQPKDVLWTVDGIEPEECDD